MPPKARATAKKGRSKDDDGEKETQKVEPMNKKGGKKEDRPKTSGVHPLGGKTIVFSGELKIDRKLHRAAIIAAGGDTTSNISPAKLSSKTHIVVTGSGGDKDCEAIRGGITVWTEDDLAHVEKTGTLPVHKNPACFHKLETTKKLDENARSFLLETALGYRWRKCEATDPGDRWSRTLAFGHFPDKKGGDCPKVSEYGADVIAPIIAEWPGSQLSFTNGEVTTSELPIIMDAIAARSDKLTPMKELHISDTTRLIDDAGALAVANALHKTKLDCVYFTYANITEKGVKALLSAVEKMPGKGLLAVSTLDFGGPGSAKAQSKSALKEWKAGSGKKSKWKISV